jgi:hypothetical protein
LKALERPEGPIPQDVIVLDRLLNHLTNFPFTDCSGDPRRPRFGNPWGMSKHPSFQRDNVGEWNEKTVRKLARILVTWWLTLPTAKLTRWIRDLDFPVISIEADIFFKQKNPKKVLKRESIIIRRASFLHLVFNTTHQHWSAAFAGNGNRVFFSKSWNRCIWQKCGKRSTTRW